MDAQFSLFGQHVINNDLPQLPKVDSACGRCLWLMFNTGFLDNHKLSQVSMGNAARRAMDLRDKMGWAIETRRKGKVRADGTRVTVSEYRVERKWLDDILENEEFRGRLLLWLEAQGKAERGGVA